MSIQCHLNSSNINHRQKYDINEFLYVISRTKIFFLFLLNIILVPFSYSHPHTEKQITCSLHEGGGALLRSVPGSSNVIPKPGKVVAKAKPRSVGGPNHWIQLSCFLRYACKEQEGRGEVQGKQEKENATNTNLAGHRL